MVNTPLPPTLSDPVRDPAAGRSDARPRRVVTWALAAIVPIAVVVAALTGLWLWVYRYRPCAREHIPEGAHVAVRIEAADVALFGPARKHLWPLVDGLGAPTHAGPSASKRSRRERIREATGVDLATDVREIVLTSTSRASWVALVGGRITAGRFVDGMAQVLRDEGQTWLPVGELLVGPGGFAMGQAEDGTLILGTDAAVAAAALPATDAYERLGLPERGAVVFALTGDAWQGIARAGAALPRSEVLGTIAHATGALQLGDRPSLELTLRPSEGGGAAALSRDAEALVAALRLATLFAPDRFGEKEALAKTEVAIEGRSVRVRAPWPIEGLDRACETLARLAPAPP